MKSFQQLSQEIIDIIKATNNYFIGNTSGMNNDGTVNVYHPKGYSVNAIAANPISSGEVIVFNVNNTWYAFGEQRTVVKEDVLIQRKSRAKKVEVYPVVTLYTLRSGYFSTPRPVKYYIGGNAVTKELIEILVDLELYYWQAMTHVHNRGDKILSYIRDSVVVYENNQLVEAREDFYFKKNNQSLAIPVQLAITNDRYNREVVSGKLFTCTGGIYEEAKVDGFNFDNPGSRVFVKDGIRQNLSYSFIDRDVLKPDGQLLLKERDIAITTLRRNGISTLTLTCENNVEEYVTFNAAQPILKNYGQWEWYGDFGGIYYIVINNEVVLRTDGSFDFGSSEIFFTSNGAMYRTTPTEYLAHIYSYTSKAFFDSEANFIRRYYFPELVYKIENVRGQPILYSGIPDRNSMFASSILEKETAEGESVIFFSIDSEIVQDYKGYIEYQTSIDIGTRASDGAKVFTENLTTLHPGEDRNIIKLVKENTEKILNTNDFGVIYLQHPVNNSIQSPAITISSINKDSVAFTLTITFNNDSSFATIKQIENYAGKPMNDSSFQGSYILSKDIDSKPALIKGEIISSILDKINNQFTINCSIDSIKTNTPSSFSNTFILDNGSFYNYFFRKQYPLIWLPTTRDNPHYNFPATPVRIIKSGYYPYYGQLYTWYFGGFINKSVLPLLCLTPSLVTLFMSSIRQQYGIREGEKLVAEGFYSFQSTYAMYNNYFINILNSINANSRTDNIVKNKIYSVVKTEGSKAWIEQWDILDNGDVKYKTVFEVDYVPLKKPKTDEGEAIAILAHSYYPK